MSFEVPEDLYYLASHEWIDPETGRVGISEFAQDELGDVVFVELPNEGEDLTQEEEFGVVESIKAVSDLYSPASGTVTAVNEALFDRPELVNDDPFGEGWMLELDVADDLDGVLSAAEYREQIE
ncbi:glycine cleavage system protein GcvH [Halalkalicoccus jeotgali]|uniref:Probable glycine cleavage system H protein n=1 Tax=Halalkalicoccus jeotgali (strain DSM 18796 / CECT 7217 / JCM 14584 / KCTC 4019 / B3) TaxID=795797 RepID=D8JAL9_HALJB|nr:glycine cleavage system protein GcvH [Halalkalicoccus jeotgali]ADJ14741.1 glycine cleavage system protein H [Halalkalicoccus jeotgali B3]ELY39323.1 glycine cleavage system protein H [Halalkalicoccus jeotgali B3]